MTCETLACSFLDHTYYNHTYKENDQLQLPKWMDQRHAELVQGEKYWLSCQLYQRSADVFLGVPFNIASYALLTHMVAQQCDLEVGEFIWTGGDVHLYLTHIEQAVKQPCRKPNRLPQLILNKAPSIFDYRYEDFVIEGYDPHPALKAEVAV